MTTTEDLKRRLREATPFMDAADPQIAEEATIEVGLIVRELFRRDITDAEWRQLREDIQAARLD